MMRGIVVRASNVVNSPERSEGKLLAMPNSLGIQVQEERGPDQSITRLPTARAAFVGRTLRGPVNRPVLIHGFADFQQVFGGLWQPSPLGYAVEQFFDNGGREALIVRVENGARAATLSLGAGPQILRLQAVSPGTREFLRACIDYDNLAADDTENFNLTVQRVRMQGTLRVEDQEIFRGLSLRPESERYLPQVLAASQLVRPTGPLPAQRPDLTRDPASGLATGYVHSNSDGDDGAPVTDYDLIGSIVERTGLFALTGADYFNFLCIPPITHDRDVGLGTLLVAARYCRERRALLIVDPPRGWQSANDAVRGLGEWNFASEDALMFFPRILAHDKLRGRFETFAPCGAVAGMLARGDELSPVWAPGNGDEPVLRPGYRTSCLVPEERRARLAALGVNTLQATRSPVSAGLRLRTLGAASAGAADWKYLATRRLALFIVNSIERGTRWIVMMRPDAEVAALVEAQVRAFFESLHAAGTFGDRSAEDSFFVIGDRRVNRERSAGRRDFNLLVGFAAERAGEFHSYRISHSVSGVAVHPATLNRLNNVQYSPEEIEWVDRMARSLSGQDAKERRT